MEMQIGKVLLLERKRSKKESYYLEAREKSPTTPPFLHVPFGP